MLTKSPFHLGESHITVISPPEFGVLAAAGITIGQVDQIALKEKIQSSKVKIVCLGKEDVNGKIVYQLIVSAPNLVNIRERVFQLFAKHGGNTALFDPSVSLERNVPFIMYLHSFDHRHSGHISLLASPMGICSSKMVSTRALMYVIDPSHSRARSNNKSDNANFANFQALNIKKRERERERAC